VQGDDGVYAILYGLLVVVIVMTAAIVVDISGMREDRRAERLASDAAATAGAVKLNALSGVISVQLHQLPEHRQHRHWRRRPVGSHHHLAGSGRRSADDEPECHWG
jgi:hypothetical protein